MITLYDVVNKDELEAALTGGLISARKHPTLPLTILNYTPECQFSRAWNPTTLQCRGLIYNHETMEVVARPFKKFFNYGEPSAPQVDMLKSCVVTDKWDGSLGILYPQGDGTFAIATRGSFESEQALHAIAVWQKRYSYLKPESNVTWLFEIVYPENRIVLDYKGLDDLICLGYVSNINGASFSQSPPGWIGMSARQFDYYTLAAALEAKPRPNAEGLVVHFPAEDIRLKIKQEDYLRLHKLITGLNEIAIWEHLSAGDTIPDLLKSIPEEFHTWVEDVALDLITRLEDLAWTVETIWNNIQAQLAHETERTSKFPGSYSRKDFALLACTYNCKASLFQKLDGKDYRPDLWKQLRPVGNKGVRPMNEDDNG